VLQKFLFGLGLDYYIENRNAVICTFAEAAGRWRDWLARYGEQLTYSIENRTFFLH
jgi:hypothetical protein